MAGIGFVLRKLTQRDDLSGAISGLFYSALISSGPWLFTVISLAMLVLFGNQFLEIDELAEFRIIIIYNFAFSLVLSAPVFMIATRCLADMIYRKDVSNAPGLLLGSIVSLFFLVTPLVFGIYVFYAQLTLAVTISAITNYFLISGIWLISIFLSALKEYASIALTFAIGMLVSLLSAFFLLQDYGVAGMLFGFNVGLAFIFFDLMARVLSEFPGSTDKPFDFLRYFKTHWEIALSGFVYNLGVWVDKWIMWFSGEAVVQKNGLVSYPHYDGAMFLAYLSIVPAIAIFTFKVETGFFEQYYKFFHDIKNHAVYAQLERNVQAIRNSLNESAQSVLTTQLTIAITLIVTAPMLLAWLQASPIQLGIFRYGVLGSAFHVFTMFLLIILSYFDVRMKVLLISVVFFLSNSLFTLVSLKLGFSWYGWGYSIAAIISFSVALAVVSRVLNRLTYETFVVRNSALINRDASATSIAEDKS